MTTFQINAAKKILNGVTNLTITIEGGGDQQALISSYIANKLRKKFQYVTDTIEMPNPPSAVIQNAMISITPGVDTDTHWANGQPRRLPPQAYEEQRTKERIRRAEEMADEAAAAVERQTTLRADELPLVTHLPGPIMDTAHPSIFTKNKNSLKRMGLLFSEDGKTVTPDPKPVCTCYLSGATGLRANCPKHGIEVHPDDQ
jgi:hypothetical protein